MSLKEKISQIVDSLALKADGLFTWIYAQFRNGDLPKRYIRRIDSELTEFELFEKDISLPHMGEGSARNAIALQLPRLSPLNINEVLYSLKRADGSGIRKLAIIRKSKFSELIEAESDHSHALAIKASSGEEYIFRDETIQMSLGKKLLGTIVLLGAIYVASLWCISQWAGYYDRVRLSYLEVTHQQAEKLTAARAQLDSVERISSGLEPIAHGVRRQEISEIFTQLDVLVAAQEGSSMKSLSWDKQSIRISIIDWPENVGAPVLAGLPNPSWGQVSQPQDVRPSRSPESYQLIISKAEREP